MKKIIKVALIIVLAVIIAGGAGFYIWAQATYKPSEELFKLIGEENIRHENDWIVFDPGAVKKAGIIIYPGAKVEPEAYSYLGGRLAENGYLVLVPEMRLNFSILEGNKADELIEHYPEIERWYIGGHSLGGVSAATYAFNHADQIDGVILLGSYPSSGSDFSDSTMPMLSIYAEKDGLTTPGKIEKTRHLLSDGADLYGIEGGNHAQFGMYGPQKGDNHASIPPQRQQDLIVKEILRWLEARS
ncbi:MULTISPECIES: alpha/beta hydrolase [Bacillaceae]|uniref:alpha/beta hydrolase n=1 Tax=Bacillaceae TaxID=186817 RepID=UPI000B9ACE18|nr:MULTISPECIES: alpha/beta hydrolase [Bacillus]MDW2878662.1 alpha/beta hydrolase [Bacillus infantis]OXT17550.1 alpha/beta hydrolase [Bacillus sp. OG2]PLR70777.1 alpha/beta hydrolase [Bacillus sp. UMB0728]